jgi:hypothetical protein
MSKFSKILQACEIFSNLVKKADYSADITDSKRALNNLKSSIEGLDIQSFKNILTEEDDEYRYLPGYLLGDQYKDCRVQFLYGNESPRENKFINFEINEQDEFPDPESIKTPIGQAYLQESYDLELRLDIDNFASYRESMIDRGTISDEFFSFEIEEGADEDEYINDLEQAYLIGLKKAIKKACSVEQPAFYHEMAHLKRMRKQNPKEFIRDWNPSKNPTQPKEWAGVNIGSDTELYPSELQKFSVEIANLVRKFNKAQEERDPSWEKMSFLDYLGQEHGIRSKYNFVEYMVGKLFGFGNLPSYEYGYPKAVVKRIAKFYDDMVAGKFKDMLGI